MGPYPPPEPAPESSLVVGLAYGLLVVLGVLLGLIGSFEFSWQAGAVPVAAIALSLVNLVVFRAAGWAMESRLGAVAPATPWMVVLVLLSSRRPEGDLVVTGTTAGYTYMFGGAVAALIAIVWTRSARPWALTALPEPPETHESTSR